MRAGAPVLVTGFGAFPGVPINPTEALARRLDGQQIAGHPIVGRVLPVSFQRGPDEAIRLARAHDVALVLGLGVATPRGEVCVESRGVRIARSRRDVDGHDRPLPDTLLVEGPEIVAASVDVDCLATALEATVSDDAGRYVCNAWLYRVAHALDVPVGFVHVPTAGVALDRLCRGIAALL